MIFTCKTTGGLINHSVALRGGSGFRIPALLSTACIQYLVINSEAVRPDGWKYEMEKITGLLHAQIYDAHKCICKKMLTLASVPKDLGQRPKYLKVLGVPPKKERKKERKKLEQK